MARSSLLGIDTAPTTAPGRDAASLGPGDNSDSGSDVAGLEDDADPGMPVDVAFRGDQPSPLPLGETTAAAEGDDTGVRDGADIGVDRIFTPGDVDLDDADARAAVNVNAEVDDEEEGEEDEKEAEDAAARPARKGSRPAAPREAADGTDESLPGEADAAERRPGRD